MAYKVFRDVVHGYIKLSDDDLKIVEHPLFQRLSRIRTGLHRTTYPCANQTRFEHSLGVAYLASLIFDSLTRKSSCETIKEYEREVKFAALCHDLGHGPFSHLTERFFNSDTLKKETCELLDKDFNKCNLPFMNRPNHELMSGLIVLKHSEINNILKKELNLNINLIFDMITGNYDTQNLENPKNILVQIMHSTLDADRLDFILRDNKMSAGDFFALDAARIISSYMLYKNHQIVLDRRALSCVANLINARSAVYEWIVNHHKNVLISNIMAQFIEDLLIYEEKLREGKLYLPENVDRFSNLFTYEGITNHKFDDYDLMCILKNNRDKIDHGETYYKHIFERKCYKSLWKSGAEYHNLIPEEFLRDRFAPSLLAKGFSRTDRISDLEKKVLKRLKNLNEFDVFAVKCKSRFYDFMTIDGDPKVNPFEKIYLYDINKDIPYEFSKHFFKRIYKWPENYMYMYVKPELYNEYKDKIIEAIRSI